MSQTPASPLDPHRSEIEDAVIKRLSLSQIARMLQERGVDTTRHSIRRALRRWDISPSETPTEEAGFTLTGEDQAEVTGRAEASQPGTLADPTALLKERGLDPEDWVVERLTVNEWDAPGPEGTILPMRQLKVHLKRKQPINFVHPAQEKPGYVRPKTTSRKGEEDPRLVVAVGDQQAPYHDSHLHDLFCGFLEENKPDEGVLIGDTVDFPDISRHPDNPEWHVGVQECIDAGYLLLRDYVQTSEATDWTKLCGNHDERIRNRLLNYQTRLYDVSPADRGNGHERSVWHISNLLHLDDLGIEYLDPNGNYDHAQVKLSPRLAARHGHIARKGSGSSALATLEHFGYSLLIGHSHRQSLVHKTVFDINGKAKPLAAAEIGCMCLIEDGLGYTPAPDWQQGFATAVVWPDGTFKIDLATYADGVLYWRDQRYQ